MKVPRAGRCYLCGKPASRSKHADHLPPESWFGKPKPLDLITVPCCLPCNNAVSGRDETLGRALACVKSDSPAQHWVWREKVSKSFSKSQKLSEDFKNKAFYTGLVDEHGEEFMAFPLPVEMFSFLKRLTKGMLATFYPDYFYFTDRFEVFCYTGKQGQVNVCQILDAGCLHASVGNKVFDVSHGLADPFARRHSQLGGIRGIWRFTFYGAVTFIVVHGWPSGKGLCDPKYLRIRASAL